MRLKLPNVANVIAAHVADTWPELASSPIDGVWFTGSQVWQCLYDMPRRDPPLRRDWDIFTTTEAAAAEMCSRLELASMPACRTRDKTRGVERSVDRAHVPSLSADDKTRTDEYCDGWSYATPRGEVDLWVTRLGDALAELRDYPDCRSHGRAAFSFTGGLLVLPNEAASSSRVLTCETDRRIGQGIDVAAPSSDPGGRR